MYQITSNENKVSAWQELYRIKQALDESSIIVITDADGIITYVNKKFCEISKYSESELIGQDHRILKSGHHPPEFYRGMWKVISEGKVWKGDIKNRKKDGAYYWVKTVIVPFLDNNGRPEKYISIRTDITKQKETQEKILRMERLSAIGELSARIAHDMRNPISVLKNSLDLMKVKNPKLDESSLKYLDFADRAIQRLLHQIDEVLDFVSPKPLKLEKTSFSRILAATLERIHHSDKIIINLPENDLELYCDPIKIEILLVNLINNAMQAMDNSGIINIRCSDENGRIIIEVQDSGTGIPDHLLDKIFEPLFTTRQIGTGLGLPSCRTIVESHGGTIQAQNNPTRFVVTIPKSEVYDKCHSD